jgi:hypothetical protein
MPLLQVRDVPKDLYENLSKVAQVENRSIAQETIILLRTALNLKQERLAKRIAVLGEIDLLNITNPDRFPDPAELINEDRNR